MNLKKRHLLFGILIAVLLIAGSYYYLQKYQEIAEEELQLADRHCIAINPLLKQRKRAYIDSVKTLQASGSAGMETFLAYQDQYVHIANEYMELETLWLRQQQAFVKRSDVQFFLDQNTRDAADYQYMMFRTELEGTQAMVKKITDSKKNTENLQELLDAIANMEKDLRIAQQGYNLKFRNTRQPFFISFVATPQSQCPEQNTDFPDIQAEVGM